MKLDGFMLREKRDKDSVYKCMGISKRDIGVCLVKLDDVLEDIFQVWTVDGEDQRENSYVQDGDFHSDSRQLMSSLITASPSVRALGTT